MLNASLASVPWQNDLKANGILSKGLDGTLHCQLIQYLCQSYPSLSRCFTVDLFCDEHIEDEDDQQDSIAKLSEEQKKERLRASRLKHSYLNDHISKATQSLIESEVKKDGAVITRLECLIEALSNCLSDIPEQALLFDKIVHFAQLVGGEEALSIELEDRSLSLRTTLKNPSMINEMPLKNHQYFDLSVQVLERSWSIPCYRVMTTDYGFLNKPVDTLSYPKTLEAYEHKVSQLSKPENRKFVLDKLYQQFNVMNTGYSLLKLTDDQVEVTMPAIALLEHEPVPVTAYKMSLISQKVVDNTDKTFVDNFLIGTLKKKIWNGLKYKLEDFSESETGYTLKIGMTNYSTVLSQCDSFMYNLISNMPEDHDVTNRTWQTIENKSFFNKWKNDLRKFNKNDGFNLEYAGMGLSVALLLKRSEKVNHYVSFVHVKSRNTNINERLHIVPASMFEPGNSCVDFEQDANITSNILREFAEEILNVPEAEHVPSNNIFMGFGYKIAAPAFQELQRLLKNGEAQILVTGIYMDLLRLRPELTVILKVDDPDYCNNWIVGNFLKFNEETESNDLNGKKTTFLVDFLPGKSFTDSLKEVGIIERSIKELLLDFAVPGVAALYKAYEHVQQLK